MLRIALGRARPDREWSANRFMASGEFKISALEFASNPVSIGAASEDEGPEMSGGSRMTRYVSEMI
jgi:hypothetical protein